MNPEHESVRDHFIQHVSTCIILNNPLGEWTDTKIILWNESYFDPFYLNVYRYEVLNIKRCMILGGGDSLYTINEILCSS